MATAVVVGELQGLIVSGRWSTTVFLRPKTCLLYNGTKMILVSAQVQVLTPVDLVQHLICSTSLPCQLRR